MKSMVDPWSSYNAPSLKSIVVFIGVPVSQFVRIVYHRAVPTSLRLGDLDFSVFRSVLQGRGVSIKFLKPAII